MSRGALWPIRLLNILPGRTCRGFENVTGSRNYMFREAAHDQESGVPSRTTDPGTGEQHTVTAGQKPTCNTHDWVVPLK